MGGWGKEEKEVRMESVLFFSSKEVKDERGGEDKSEFPSFFAAKMNALYRMCFFLSRSHDTAHVSQFFFFFGPIQLAAQESLSPFIITKKALQHLYIKREI